MKSKVIFSMIIMSVIFNLLQFDCIHFATSAKDFLGAGSPSHPPLKKNEATSLLNTLIDLVIK